MSTLHRSMIELREQLEALGRPRGHGLSKIRLLGSVRRAWDEEFSDVVDECMRWRDLPDDLARTVLLDLIALAYMRGRESARRQSESNGGAE